ncbi:hypothetical protein IQ06DRAFT_294254 [Phaeosphaeriaceae sp. SRC1lsM3a]|nr:hypothetical protein IQ06DRAFT_294254 [Stagonospora sp. SRC1lsM3a]
MSRRVSILNRINAVCSKDSRNGHPQLHPSLRSHTNKDRSFYGQYPSHPPHYQNNIPLSAFPLPYAAKFPFLTPASAPSYPISLSPLHHFRLQTVHKHQGPHAKPHQIFLRTRLHRPNTSASVCPLIRSSG